ncbi:MAG: WD40 repeat domain-containing protein [bacterium]|nr:WD40 repeat domain-containing protein [bacterium]
MKTLKGIYSDYREAIRAEDVDTLKGFLSADGRKELSGEGENLRMKLKMIKELSPADIKITGGEVSGATAVLKVEGRMQKQKMTGTVEFLKEGGKWKISKEGWAITVDMTETPGTAGFQGVVEPFMKDPAQPPQPHHVLVAHQGEVSSLAFTPDGRYLISASYGDYSLRVWDPVSGSEVSTATTPKRVRAIAIHPGGKSILTADTKNTILSWPLEAGEIGIPKTLAEDAGDRTAVKPDGKYFVTLGWKKNLRLWNLPDGTHEEKLSGDTNFRSLTFSKSGKWLACGTTGNQYYLWDTKKWKRKKYTINKVSAKSDVSSIDISNDDKYMATGHMDSSIVIFDLEKRRELHNFYVTNASTWDVKFTPDGSYLVTAQQDKSIYLWEVRSARRAARLQKHGEAVKCLAFSPDGTTLASGGEDRKIILWRTGPAPAASVKDTPAAPSGSAGSTGTQPPDSTPEMVEVEGEKNLIKNPYANQGKQFWKTKGDTSIEEDDEGNPYFVIRYKGMFWQDVPIPGATGRWVLLIAWSSSERINQVGDQTGLPYLYGYWVNSKDKNRFNGYLHGQQMLHSVREPDEWGVIWGVFKVPAETGAIRFFLQQADGRTAQDGSAARFDDPGIYLFNTEEAAKAFVEKY